MYFFPIFFITGPVNNGPVTACALLARNFSLTNLTGRASNSVAAVELLLLLRNEDPCIRQMFDHPARGTIYE